MPNDDDWLAENLDWSDRQEQLFERMAHQDADILNDEMLQQVFNVGFFDFDVDHDTRVAAREWVSEYVEAEYGFLLEEYFDWEAWREMYGDT
jgi:hypothetical protein